MIIIGISANNGTKFHHNGHCPLRWSDFVSGAGEGGGGVAVKSVQPSTGVIALPCLCEGAAIRLLRKSNMAAVSGAPGSLAQVLTGGAEASDLVLAE